MKIKFTNGKVINSTIAGAVVFLIAPVGLGASLILGGVAAISTMAAQILNEKAKDEAIEYVELHNDPDMRTVIEPAVLVMAAGALIALPTAGTVLISFALKAYAFYYFKNFYYDAIVRAGFTPKFKREYSCSFKVDDSQFTFTY